MSTTETIKKLRELLETGPQVSKKQMQEAPGLVLFLSALQETLPVVLDEIERAQGQEKQTAATLDGFAGDLEKAYNAAIPTEIHCPQCNMVHVDQDEWATTRLHRKHLCHGCGHIWAPYCITTVGVDYHVECRKKIESLEERAKQLEADTNWLRSMWEMGIEENKGLIARRDELLALVAKLSQSVPLESEVAEALAQRGTLLAEVGTLRARVAELEKLTKTASPDTRTEYDGTDYG